MLGLNIILLSLNIIKIIIKMLILILIRGAGGSGRLGLNNTKNHLKPK